MMPSLSSLFKSSRLSQQFEKTDTIQNEAVEKAQSKRGFFHVRRRLVKRSSADTRTTPTIQHSNEESFQTSTPALERSALSPSPNVDPPLSPMSNSNKPLPPPPPVENVIEDSPPKPSLKLGRIIAPLAPEDLQKLFSGAPQFFAAADSEGSGTPHPSVAYPFNELGVDDLSDHLSIQIEAWKCVTAWAHVTAQYSNEASVSKQKPMQQQRFLPRCHERPSMLSMQGLERGTVGFQAALELGVADALQDPGEEYSFKETSDYRWKALNGKEGIRALTDSALIEQLRVVSDTYHGEPDKDERSSIELYTELFTHILHPPSRVTDVDDPYSLVVQIEALIHVLAMKHLWYDFSKVEWRIRLGLILWGSSWELEGEVEINNREVNESNTQKYWLLLQILLSCQLLLRMDMIFANVDAPRSKSEALRLFEKQSTPSVKWSVILARQWLENIKVQGPIPSPATDEKPTTGWLASLTGSAPSETVLKESISDLKYEGRHESRQVRGLVHFARNINWPNLDLIISKVSANGVTLSDGLGDTPIATPRSASTQRSSYFASRPGMRRGLSSIKDRMSAIIHPAGWLSNSYISGLILPGESLSHFLMSTVLENDAEAVAKLGDEASLYGGFVYQSKSFWSTTSIVGRILAAGKGASECMGWVSSDIVPRGVKESWVDIDVEPVDENTTDKKERRPRISRKATVEQRGHIIAGADESSVLPGDFISPFDETSEEAVLVTFQSLDLFAIDDTSPPTPMDEEGQDRSTLDPPQIRMHSAMMRFTIQVESELLREINLSLSKDVYFLTAHPCIPPPRSPQSSPASPSFHPLPGYKVSENSGHPLHKAFTYTKITLSMLLSTPATTPLTTLLIPPKNPTAAHLSTQHTTSSGIPKVLVIDCTDSTMEVFPPNSSNPAGVVGMSEQARNEFGSDLEMLGRAVCSERGWNALVSRKGRGCLSCAVREAGAVGWRVILRVA